LAGELRTYCWAGTCLDAFELPPATELPLLAVDPSARELEFRLATDAGFYDWTASYGDGTMAELRPLAGGGEPYDPDLSATVPPTITVASMTRPPSGNWIVYVVIRAPSGEAHYAWHVKVS